MEDGCKGWQVAPGRPPDRAQPGGRWRCAAAGGAGQTRGITLLRLLLPLHADARHRLTIAVRRLVCSACLVCPCACARPRAPLACGAAEQASANDDEEANEAAAIRDALGMYVRGDCTRCEQVGLRKAVLEARAPSASHAPSTRRPPHPTRAGESPRLGQSHHRRL